MMLVDHLGRPIMAEQYQGGALSRHRRSEGVRNPRPYDEDRVVGAYKLGRLREQCLALRRDNPVVAGTCKRFADHVVGPRGITPQAKTDDPAWNEAAEDYWREWEKIADFRQRMNMREMQAFCVESRLCLGDCGHVLLQNGQMQPVEAMRIADPDKKGPDDQIIQGIRVSPSGIPLKFFVHARDKNGLVSAASYEAVNREDFIFVVSPFRADQLRGIPELAPIITSVEDFDEMQKLNIEKAKLDAMNAWAVKTDQGASRIANLGARGYSDGATTNPQMYERFHANAVHYLNRGEEIMSLESKTPNAQYVQFCELTLRIIASALSIPYEFLVLDFKQGSFSASRAALMTTYRTFSMWQQWLIDRFLQRTWNWRIAKAIKAGELPPAPVDARGYSQWWRVTWMTPRYDWIDPKAEAASNESRVRQGTASVGGIAHVSGNDVEDVMDDKKREFIAAGVKVKETNDALAGLGLPDRVGISSFIQVDGAARATEHTQAEVTDEA